MDVTRPAGDGTLRGRCRAALVAAVVVVPMLPGVAAARGASPLPQATVEIAPPPCTPLPAATGRVVRVSTEPELQAAIRGLVSDTTVLIADGVYTLTNTLNIRGVDRVTVRAASGDRDAVVLRGLGMSNAAYGNVAHVLAIDDADDVQIADLTLRDAYHHLVQVHGETGAQRPRFTNLHLVDSGQQFIKVSTNGAQQPRRYSDGGVVECSLFEYTERARSNYTNAIDILAGAGWRVRDSEFRNIRAPEGQVAGPAILAWRNSIDTVIERNRFMECDRAIALGLMAPDANSRDGEATYDHQGGIVRNNTVARRGAGDVGITVNHARGFAIEHNTVVLNATFPWTIEYRFASTEGTIAGNLSDGPIQARDAARATLVGNVGGASGGWFVDAVAGDLHLLPGADGAIDRAVPLPGVTDDIDGQPRPSGPAGDVGADELGRPPAAPRRVRPAAHRPPGE